MAADLYAMTPARLQARIQRAEHEADELESLPALPQDDTSVSDDDLHRLPRHGYDVGVEEVTQNTPFMPRNRHLPLGSRLDHNSKYSHVPKPPSARRNHLLPSNPLTSTPTAPSNGFSDFPAFKTRNYQPPIPAGNFSGFPGPSPHVSLIETNDKANKFAGNMVIVSASGSDADIEADAKPVVRRNSPSSSDSDDTSRASKSLGDIDFGELENFEVGLDGHRSHPKHTRPLDSVAAMPGITYCPSPVASNSSGSQATLIQSSLDGDNHHGYATANSGDQVVHPKSGSSIISSPGMGRRNSPRADLSLSAHEIIHALSEHSDVDSGGYSGSRYDGAPSALPEAPPARSLHNQTTINRGLVNLARRKSVLLSNLKSAHAATPARFAKSLHSIHHLAQALDDSSDMSGLPDGGNLRLLANRQLPADSTETDSTSHDLTTFAPNRHANGNSSISDGDPSQRLNVVKMNTYLHSLNTRLSTENQQLLQDNERLHEELRRAVEDKQRLMAHESNLNAESQIFNPQRLALERQIGRLQDSLKDRDLELNNLRSAALDNSPDILQTQLKELFGVKDALSQAIEEIAKKDEDVNRVKRDQMEEAGQHASIVTKLRAELEKAQNDVKRVQEKLDCANSDIQNAEDKFAAKMDLLKKQVSDVLGEQDRNLEFNLTKLNQASTQAEERAQELTHLRSKLAKSEQDLEEITRAKSELEKLLHNGENNNPQLAAGRRVHLLEAHIETLESQLKSKGEAVHQATFAASQAAEKHAVEMGRLREQVEELQNDVAQITQELSDETVRASGLSEALQVVESRRRAQDAEVASLQAQRDLLEAEVISYKSSVKGLEVRLTRALESAFAVTTPMSRKSSPRQLSRAQENELREAQQELSRIKSCMTSSNGVVNCEIQSVKIKALEAHCNELGVRVSALRHQASALASTPGHSEVFRSIISMRTPKTPNQLLANMTTFASDSNATDETIVPMLSQIHELQHQVSQLWHQLDLANQDVDSKVLQLAQAGENAVCLSSEAIIAKSRVVELEEQLAKLTGENGIINQVVNRLASVQCPECDNSFDVNDIVKLRVLPQTNSVELTVRTVNSVGGETSPPKTKLQELRTSYQESQKRIQELTSQLDAHVDELRSLEAHKEEDERYVKRLQDSLEASEAKVGSLVADLSRERQSYQELFSSHQLIVQEKDDMQETLQQMTADLASSREELSQIIKSRDSVEAEVRALHQLRRDSDGVAQRVKSLEATINQLEAQKSEAVASHSSIAEQLSSATRELERKTQMMNSSEKAYHRVQSMLEKQTSDVNQLRVDLETHKAEVSRLKASKGSLLEEASVLRADLAFIRSQAQDSSHQLQQIRSRLHPSAAAAKSKDAARLRDEFFSGKRELTAQGECQDSHNQAELQGEVERRHNLESKGLLLRIRFLKLMYTRENFFRADLAVQKRILITKLSETELRNEAIHATLEKFGLPFSPHPGNFTLHRLDRTFKGVALAVQAMCKMRTLSKRWKNEERVKKKLKEAYREVRGKEFLED